MRGSIDFLAPLIVSVLSPWTHPRTIARENKDESSSMTSFHRGDWLALWQAIGGMLAVAAAALVPFVHGLFTEHRARLTRLRALVEICELIQDRLEHLELVLGSQQRLEVYQIVGVTREWVEFENILSSFPLWEFASGQVALRIAQCRAAVARGHDVARNVMEFASVDDDGIDLCALTVQDCLDDVTGARTAFTLLARTSH